MFAAWINAAMLAAEAQQVVWLRCLKISRGGVGADTEARLMVIEKIEAAALAGRQLLAGETADKVVKTYRRAVQANARRLSP
jgi:hypothetical protein